MLFRARTILWAWTSPLSSCSSEVKVTSGGIQNFGSSRLERPAVSVEDIVFNQTGTIVEYQLSLELELLNKLL